MAKSGYYGISREDEEHKYNEICQIAHRNVLKTKNDIQGLANELHELQEVYDASEKEGLAQWFTKDQRFKEVRRELLRAERVSKKPYFGRIDFVDEDEKSKVTYYVGKSVLYEDPKEPVVIDWRSPIASVYYESSLGKCRYKVPHEGAYEIDLERKRTYEISDKGLIDYYDSEVVANDDLLTKYLSKSKRNVLSEIIATIQQEQNDVIRINPHHNVLIQGSAGSGKTTVAMHRISYILYNYEREFDAKDFYIVGSNKVLLNYITGVLPDLDVYGLPQMTMEELFIRLLYEEWDDKKKKVRKLDKTDSSIGIKGQSEWSEDLITFCENYFRQNIPFTDIKLKENNHILMSSSDIEKILDDMKGRPIKSIYERLKDILISRLETEMFGRGLSYSEEMQKRMYAFYERYFERRQIKESVWDIYEQFVKSQINKGVKTVYIKNEPDLYDLASLAYIYKRLKETEVVREACHVVIDEAQDFGITVYKSLKYCLDKCTFTIMGDVAQNINLGCGLGDWEELKKVMLPDEYDYFGLLRKSYRNTIEISNFATDVLKHGTFPIYPVEPIIRHGKDVEIAQCENDNDLIERIAKQLIYWSSDYETCAVVCRNNEEAFSIRELLEHKLKEKNYVNHNGKTLIHCFDDQNETLDSGITILPIEYAKGLEFDAVIIADASVNAYPKEDGYAKLLYVAATRALHELVVFHKGSLTGLIADEIPADRMNLTFEEDNYHKKALVMEEDNRTTAEIAKEEADIGHKERKLRSKLGPKKVEVLRPEETLPVTSSLNKQNIIEKNNSDEKVKTVKRPRVVAPPKTDAGSYKTIADMVNKSSIKPREIKSEKQNEADMRDYLRSGVFGVGGVTNTTNQSLYKKGPEIDSNAKKDTEFGDFPDDNSLRPLGHGAIDHAIKWLESDENSVTLISAYDKTIITVIAQDTIRITIYKGHAEKYPIPDSVKCENSVSWKCNQGKASIDIITSKLQLSVDKKTGQIKLLSLKKGEILAENSRVSRQYNEVNNIWWHFFDWGKKEELKAMDENGKFIDVSGNARFVSHGKASNCPTTILSSKGYRIIIPAGIKVLLNSIKANSQYLKYDKSSIIDCFIQVEKM